MILASRLRLAVVASTFLPTARAFSAIPPKRSILCASQNYYYNKRSIGIQMAFSAWIACPSCHGEGKRFRAPSKKAQLKHKRTKLDNTDTRLPPRLEPCRNCQQTGIILQDDSSKLSIEKFPRVAIIGGGLGGFALGIACSHRGIPFSIFERDTSFLMRAQGYGLTLQQASRALASFGIQSLPEGVTSTRHVVHTTDGTVVGEWGLRKWGRDATKKPPKRQNIHISRQALRRELLEAVGEANVSWGHKLVDVIENKRDDGSIELHLETSNGKIIQETADLVVGADGIRSTVRTYLLGSEVSPLRYLDCLVVLGICPLDKLPDVTRQNGLLDGHTVFQTADGSTRIYLMPYSSTEYMWQLSFPMEDEDSAKDLSDRGPAALKSEALAKCGLWHDPIPEILQNTPIGLVSGYPVYDRNLITYDMLNTSRPITLIGDAAHPMSPFKGQGANQALLDALSLARCLYASSCKEQSDVMIALSNYHQEMIERSTKKVQASAQAAQFLHTQVAIQKGNITRGAAASTTATTTSQQGIEK